MKEIPKEELAKFMHETYELYARALQWQTQKKCQVPYEELPEENRLVMEATAGELLTKFRLMYDDELEHRSRINSEYIMKYKTEVLVRFKEQIEKELERRKTPNYRRMRG